MSVSGRLIYEPIRTMGQTGAAAGVGLRLRGSGELDEDSGSLFVLCAGAFPLAQRVGAYSASSHPKSQLA